MVTELSDSLLDFLASKLGVQRSCLQPTTRLHHDLGVDGEDGHDLLLAFSKVFSVDLSGIDPDLHFGPEAGSNPLVWLWWLATFSWPKLVPIELQDLQASVNAGRWVLLSNAAA